MFVSSSALYKRKILSFFRLSRYMKKKNILFHFLAIINFYDCIIVQVAKYEKYLMKFHYTLINKSSYILYTLSNVGMKRREHKTNKCLHFLTMYRFSSLWFDDGVFSIRQGFFLCLCIKCASSVEETKFKVSRESSDFGSWSRTRRECSRPEENSPRNLYICE